MRPLLAVATVLVFAASFGVPVWFIWRWFIRSLDKDVAKIYRARAAEMEKFLEEELRR